MFHLTHTAKHDRIWSARRKLKGSQYRLADDLPEAYRKASWSTLMPVMGAVRFSNTKAMFVGYWFYSIYILIYFC